MRRADRTSHVYFVQHPSGAIQIGSSFDPEKRCAQIARTHKGAELLGQIEAPRMLEKIIQNRFLPYWIEGQLFMPCKEIFAFLGVPDRYRPDARFGDRLLLASWRSALGKGWCKMQLGRPDYQDQLAYRNPWWFAFYPPAYPAGEVVKWQDRWWRESGRPEASWRSPRHSVS